MRSVKSRPKVHLLGPDAEQPSPPLYSSHQVGLPGSGYLPGKNSAWLNWKEQESPPTGARGTPAKCQHRTNPWTSPVRTGPGLFRGGPRLTQEEGRPRRTRTNHDRRFYVASIDQLETVEIATGKFKRVCGKEFRFHLFITPAPLPVGKFSLTGAPAY